MSRSSLSLRTLGLLAVMIPLLLVFFYVVARSGPLAKVKVTAARVESGELRLTVFGLGTVEARYFYKIGPTTGGRLESLSVDVGDLILKGQPLGKVDPGDLDALQRSLEAAMRRAHALLKEAESRRDFAQIQFDRYEKLYQQHFTTEEVVATRRMELRNAESMVLAGRAELERVRAERDALLARQLNLELISPVNGIVIARAVEPGMVVGSGQTVLEAIDPDSLWIHARFDQRSAGGLVGGLPAQISLRSRAGQPLAGEVLRIEPRADAITEEIQVRIIMKDTLEPLPPLGELAEVTVELPRLPPTLLIPNAAVRRDGITAGVWIIEQEKLRFAPVKLGKSDPRGTVQVLEGLTGNEQIVVHSAKALTKKSRIQLVESIREGSS